MLYERAAKEVLTLYVCPVENILSKVPLIQCYLNGNKVGGGSPGCRYCGVLQRESAE
jgi:hypothetical protein